MSRRTICFYLLSLFAVTCVSEATAQIGSRVRQRIAASLQQPPAPEVAPEGQSIPAATPPAPPARGGFLARRLQMRRDLVAQQAAQAQPTPAAPTPAQQQAADAPQGATPLTPRTVRRRSIDALRQASAQVAPVLRTLTQEQISQMNLQELQSALVDTNGNLANELTQFSSAASWQRFFEMPAGIVEDRSVDIGALQTVMLRFENVAATPKFAQISGLSSFQQTKTLLTELLSRANPQSATFDGPQLIDPLNAAQLSVEGAESLPPPEPTSLPRNKGEHSILLPKNS